MKWDIIISVVVFNVAAMLIAGWYTNNNNKKQNKTLDMATGGRSLGAFAVGSTLCMTLLGSGNITGTYEGVYTTGLSVLWHSMGNGFALCLGAASIMIWARRMRVTTTGEMLTRLYGKALAVIVSAFNIVVGFAVACCEIQALGIAINAVTGMELHIAVILATVLALLYILIGGMKQGAILNQFFIVILYIGVILVFVVVGKMLPGGTYDTVREFYAAKGEASMLSITGGTQHFMSIALPLVMSNFFCHMSGQYLMQTACSAKSEKSIKKTVWWVGPVNCLVAATSAIVALVANTMPEYAKLDAKTQTMTMLVNELPRWLIIVFLIAFTVGILSTFASFVMSSATTITVDFVSLYKPEMNEKEKNRYIRIGLVVSAVIIAILAQFLPAVIVLFQWLFAQMLPIIFFLIIGLFWKRNLKLAVVTMISTWAVTNIWTFTPLPRLLGLEGLNMIWIILAVTLILQIIGNLILPGKPGYFRSDEWTDSEQFKIYLEEKNKGVI
ncbi:hypothetical protein EAI28_09255 [Faecalicatena contorta]|uniref:sodium:solute symporter family protein n=1 Tax=Faecalicatena contorta TaxID=39482 RepID=UPI00129D5028|nr:hypothetical protein [Faecalicatena contorta]